MRLFTVLAMFALCATTRAEEPFALERTPGQLPEEVLQRYYAIRVVPNVEKAAFTGSNTIETEARKPTRQILRSKVHQGFSTRNR